MENEYKSMNELIEEIKQLKLERDLTYKDLKEYINENENLKEDIQRWKDNFENCHIMLQDKQQILKQIENRTKDYNLSGNHNYDFKQYREDIVKILKEK